MIPNLGQKITINDKNKAKATNNNYFSFFPLKCFQSILFFIVSLISNKDLKRSLPLCSQALQELHR